MQGSVYSPGAGHLPKVLVGRDELLKEITLRLNETATVGRVRSDDVIYTGIRGVGKTAMLTAYAATASAQGFEVISHQAVVGRSGLVQAMLARAQRRIDEGAGAWQRAKRAFERVAGASVGTLGVSASLNVREAGRERLPVDPETLAAALATLAEEVRRDRPAGGVLITVDEMQVASAEDLPLLAATLHRLNVDYPAAGVAFAGSGLPHVPVVLREFGVTHPDRLFRIEALPPTLSAADALYAVIEPARQAGVTWEPDAAAMIVKASNGYPAHLQLFADAAWTAAEGPNVVTMADVHAGVAKAGDRLAVQSFRPRMDELSGRQLEYLAALALCGGDSTSQAVAHTLGRSHKDLSWVRDDLLRAGDIHSPGWGRVVMSMPQFGPYLLAHYEAARELVATDLVPLGQMSPPGRQQNPSGQGHTDLPPDLAGLPTATAHGIQLARQAGQPAPAARRPGQDRSRQRRPDREDGLDR